jgi:hypothetical protein
VNRLLKRRIRWDKGHILVPIGVTNNEGSLRSTGARMRRFLVIVFETRLIVRGKGNRDNSSG